MARETTEVARRAPSPPVHVDATAETLPDAPMFPPEQAIPDGTSRLAEVLAAKGLLDKAVAILAAPIPTALLAIKPTGEVYLPQVHYRNLLHRLFPLGWGMQPLPGYPMPKVLPGNGNTEKMVWPMTLVVYGVPVAIGVGQGSWNKNNPRASLGDAAESAKSDAIVRACKDLGIAAQCWDPVFAARFVKEHCVRVRVKTWQGKIDVQWRRRDRDPLPDELGLAPEGERPSPETIRRPEATTDAEVVPEAPPPAAANGTIDQKDIARLMAVAHEHGVGDDALKAHLASAYHCRSRKLIKRADFDAILGWVRQQDGAEA